MCHRRILCVILLLVAKYAVGANESATLRTSIENAVLFNPGVLASWNAFLAANEGVRAAKGGFYPKLDLLASKGKERVVDPLNVEDSYDVENIELTLTQMLFDGFATKQAVDQQHYAKLARYYEFRSVSEELALETATAYLDVVRFRALLALAKDNYYQHVRYHRDIEDRVKSGIGRGVDLEQATARLALAQSNVLTETTNLHDVSARYQRLVGYFPAKSMPTPELPVTVIPVERKDALLRAFSFNPELNASIENIRSTRADFRGKNAPMMPRLDLRLRKQLDENSRGTLGEYDEEAIELVLSYNLYNGGSDRASRRQSKYLMFEAIDTRDRICREVRQTVSIAYNDIYSKQTLIGYLELNLQSISKARAAYKNQFDIGQRTLLDLLDTENEYFEVERSLVNAKHEHLLAELRTLTGMGQLLYALNIEGLDNVVKEDLALAREESLSAKCPAEAPYMQSVEFDVNKILGDRARPVPMGQTEIMRLDVKFGNQSSQLTGGNIREIKRAADFLCNNPLVKGVVEGHTDATGANAYNLALSKARAESVRNAIAKACPDSDARLSAMGFGETRPVASNNTAIGRATNRRVVLVLDNSLVTSLKDEANKANSHEHHQF